MQYSFNNALISQKAKLNDEVMMKRKKYDKIQQVI